MSKQTEHVNDKTNGKSNGKSHNATAARSEAENTVEEGPVRHAVRTSTSFISSNAVPLALIGAGATILAMRTVNGGDNRVAHSVETVRERAAEGARHASERVRHGREIAGEKVGDGVRKSSEVVRSNPVATGVAAMAIGAGIAAAAPYVASRRNHAE